MIEYVKYMRQHIGHAPLLLVGGSVIVENENGEILLQQRTDNGCWGYPGGAMEPGECVEDTAKRELFEETGLIAEALQLFNVFSGEATHYIYSNGDEVHIVDVVYCCTKFHGQLRLDPIETKALRFFPLTALPDNISPPVALPLHSYLNAKMLSAVQTK